jgi:uncharacterized protein YigA (DUF484 family)
MSEHDALLKEAAVRVRHLADENARLTKMAQANERLQGAIRVVGVLTKHGHVVDAQQALEKIAELANPASGDLTVIEKAAQLGMGGGLDTLAPAEEVSAMAGDGAMDRFVSDIFR